jgi:hypothetical protein
MLFFSVAVASLRQGYGGQAFIGFTFCIVRLVLLGAPLRQKQIFIPFCASPRGLHERFIWQRAGFNFVCSGNQIIVSESNLSEPEIGISGFWHPLKKTRFLPEFENR